MNKACSHGKTVLIQAVSLGNTEQVKFLLNKGADINAYDSRQCNALFYSSLEGNPAILQLLIEAGADVNASAFREKAK